jgi:predicted aspartyl protease
MYSLKLAAVVLLGLPAPLAAQITQVETVSGPALVDDQTQTQDVAFKNDRHQRMTVAVRLGGSGPFRFMVDTGADRTAVSRQLAGRLGLAKGPGGQLHSVTGISAVETVTVRELQLSVRTIGKIDAPVLDAEHLGAEGILGTDTLRSQRVMFDFKNKLLSITPSQPRKQKDEAGTIVVQASRRAGRLIVTEASADNQRVTVVLDTGSEVSIGNMALKRVLTSRRLLQRNGKIELVSVTGEKLIGDYAFLKQLEMGGVTLQELGIVFADAHTFRQMELDNRPALLLGMNALQAFDKVSIDFANKKLRVLLPTGSSLAQKQFAVR